MSPEPRLSRRIRRISEPLIDTFNRRARALAAGGTKVISLGQAIPGFEPPAAALDAARAALRRAATHVYAPDAGEPQLQRDIARWIARHDGIAIDPETQLIVTAGGNQAMLLALQCCTDAGDRVLLGSPYFMNHEMAVRLVDAEPVEVPTRARDGWVITARALDRAAARKARAVIITTPSNPTGAVVPPTELARISRWCARKGMFLILDRTYAGYEFERQPVPARPTALPPHVAIVGSFSKVFAMTGWRVGYLAGSPELIREALKAQDTTIICAPTISQIAVGAALRKHPGVPAPFMRELGRRRDYVQRRIAEIPGWSAVPAAGGFFTFVRVEGCKDSVAFARRILDRAHVVVMPGRIFGKAGEGHIRISYGVQGIPQLKVAFERIKGSA